MSATSTHITKVFRFLHSLSLSCGRVPLIAALCLILCWQWGSARRPSPVPLPDTAGSEQDSSDAALIDGVLSKRAPELGLILRQQLGRAIAEEAHQAGYDPLLILAIIAVESSFEESAVSSKGARGLMQIQPSTLAFLLQKQGIRLTAEEVEADPALRVRLGVRYLRSLHRRFGDLDRALMAYNAGPLRIRHALREKEAYFYRRYPRLVRSRFRRFREGEGTEGDWALAQRDRTAHP